MPESAWKVCAAAPGAERMAPVSSTSARVGSGRWRVHTASLSSGCAGCRCTSSITSAATCTASSTARVQAEGPRDGFKAHLSRWRLSISANAYLSATASMPSSATPSSNHWCSARQAALASAIKLGLMPASGITVYPRSRSSIACWRVESRGCNATVALCSQSIRSGLVAPAAWIRYAATLS